MTIGFEELPGKTFTYRIKQGVAETTAILAVCALTAGAFVVGSGTQTHIMVSVIVERTPVPASVVNEAIKTSAKVIPSKGP